MSTDLRKERIDLKKLWSQFINKLWIVIAATLVGAISFVLIYVLYSNIAQGNTVYQIRNDYYIYLDYESYPNGPDFYNAYTWDGILRDDPVVNYALQVNPSITKEQILEAVSGEILGDYRILTVVVKGTDANLVTQISDTYKIALPHFAEEIDMIEHIDVWTDAEIEEFDEYTREGNAAFLGGFIGLLISIFAILIYCALDDRIYSEKDWNSRYLDIPYLGKADTEEYKVNAEYLLGGRDDSAGSNVDTSEYYKLKISEFEFSVSLFSTMRASKGVLLYVNSKADRGDAIDKVVMTLKKQNINIVGMIME